MRSMLKFTALVVLSALLAASTLLVSAQTQVGNFLSLVLGTAKVTASVGSAAPEGSVSAPVGSVYLRTTAGSGTTLYVKERGSSNVGWGAAGLVKMTSITLIDAQIKALPTTPIQLVAAQGSGFRVRPIAVSYSADTSAGAYTSINTTYADLHLLLGTDYVGYGPVNDSTTTPTLTLVTDLLGATATRIFDQGLPPQQATPVSAANGYTQTIAIYNKNQQNNAALMLAMDNNSSGNLMTGNALNTLKVTVYYTVEAL